MSIFVGFKVTTERERTRYLHKRKAGKRTRVTMMETDKRTAAAAENAEKRCKITIMGKGRAEDNGYMMERIV